LPRGELLGRELGSQLLSANEVDRAADLGIIGPQSRSTWLDTGYGSSGPVTATQDSISVKARVAGMQDAAKGQPPATEAPLPPRDIHEAARTLAPSVFSQFDPLALHVDELRGRIAEAQDALRRDAEAQAPHQAEIADLQDRLQDATPRLAKKYEARLADLVPARDAFLADDFTMSALTRDTPEILAMRDGIQAAHERMADLAPEVTAAYREDIQPNSFTNQGGLWPLVIEGSDDNLAMQIQQVQNQANRALLFNPADTGPFATFPPAAQRALKMLGFDGNGNPIAAQPSSALVSSAMAPFVASTTLPAATALLTTLAAGTGAVSRSVAAKLADFVSIRDFGATGNDTTDDTAAIQAAENAAAAGGFGLWFPGGTYMINTGGLTKLAVNWRSDGSATIKAATGTWTNQFISAIGASNWSIEGFVFDTTNVTFNQTTLLFSTIALNTCSNWRISFCNFNGIQVFGIALNGGSYWTIANNIFTKPVPGPQQNDSILISTGGVSCTGGLITDNIMIGAAMDVLMTNSTISRNYIIGWKCGAGVTTELNALCSSLKITDNVIINGSGIDVNGTVVNGIENWAPYSIIAGNIIAGCAGDGLDNGGAYSIVSHNYCINNGQIAGCGISTRVGAGGNGSYSTYIGNYCTDTQTPHTQTYGYIDQTSAVTDVTLIGNEFGPALHAPMAAIGARCNFHGPQLAVSGIAYGLVTVTAGSYAGGSAVMSGAGLGDFVQVTHSQNLGGLIASGWVTAANAISFAFRNVTTSSITLAAGSINVLIEKPLNYAAY
jgi:hypothetical protein